MSNAKAPSPSQNIDVHFWQTRVPNEWKARVVLSTKSHVIGPASIAAVIMNVMNLVRVEAMYADIKVHGLDLTAEDPKPMMHERRTSLQAGLRRSIDEVLLCGYPDEQCACGHRG